ncbi:putative biosynthetic protein (TIGR04099 family) [Sphingomonas sp. SORGH_AS 950]|uniref:Pnap_2097 family protein n=1 Tax=Sphingomonas sp. SORGH_AS_0950 TaxID=3041792 RepID=UPI002781606E|nr:Pnap_2097 family protein [Sphingomonas sp. SORGH_AS_0950]MDQ1155865.1 putative biosynthetic protein (TIGR04099 family) [Sphingomonas sp. SORGH_AS_0950]
MTAILPAIRPVATDSIRIGMPEMCRGGLSETWLWKAAGHRHWLALATAHGLDRPDFRDATGARLYAAFTETQLAEGRLDRVGEHDLLTFDTHLSRTGRTRFRSIVTVSTAKEVVGRLTLDSAFVGRRHKGRNRSAARGLVARPCHLLPPAHTHVPFRPATWDWIGPFQRKDRQELASCVIDPNPHEDFNGADFLYFASYAALADRAEWHWFHQADPIVTTRSRRTFFLGNIELGDTVTVLLCGTRSEGDSMSHWIELRRTIDGALLAVSFAERGLRR